MSTKTQVRRELLAPAPKKIPPTKMLISSTRFQRTTSYLVHINFCLCMIIPQSFQFVRQIVRLWSSLRNVFQTTPWRCRHTCKRRAKLSMTQTHSSRDRPDPGCNCCLQVTDCVGVVFVHSVLQITPKVKNMDKSGTHSMSLTPPTDKSILESLP